MTGMPTLRRSHYQRWLICIGVPLLVVPITTLFSTWVSLKTGQDFGGLSFLSALLITTVGFWGLSNRRRPLEKCLIAVAYFPLSLFFWFQMTFVSAALLGGKGNL